MACSYGSPVARKRTLLNRGKLPVEPILRKVVTTLLRYTPGAMPFGITLPREALSHPA